MKKTYWLLLILVGLGILNSANLFANENRLDSLKRAANDSKIKNNDTLLIKTLIDIAYLYNDIQLDSSERYIKMAKNKLQTNNWEKGNALYHRVYGHYFFRAGLYDKALIENFAVQKIAQKLHDFTLEASVNIRIGTLLTYLNRTNEAHRYLEEGARIYKKIGNQTEYGVALANRGDAYLKSGEYRKAIGYFKQCMVIIQKSDDANPLKESRIVAGNNLMAVAYLNLGLLDSSIICARICQDLGEKTNNQYNLYDMYRGFAEYYLRKNNTTQSINYAQKALEKAEQLNSIEKRSTIFNVLYLNFKKS